MYRILQKHSKRLKFAHFCSGSPFIPKRHNVVLLAPKCTAITVSPPFDLPFVPQYQNFQSLLAQMPSVKKTFESHSFNVKADSLLYDELQNRSHPYPAYIPHTPSYLTLSPKVESRRQEG